MSATLARSNAATRSIVHRTRGAAHGPVARLVSPGDVGQLIKPFVFLDLFSIEQASTIRFGMHPHSGIATLTALVSGEVHFQDRDGGARSMHAGGVEWMMAGGGVWHGSPLTSPAATKGFQLWVALPPSLEEAKAEEIFLQAHEVPAVGPARVLLGDYQGARSPIPAPSALAYLHVTLTAGESWTFQPPEGHSVAWIAVHDGAVEAGERVSTGELAVFEESSDPISFLARQQCGFVLGCAVKHPHDLVTGYYSVHTNAASLAKGEARIAELGEQLRRAGRIA